MPLAGDDPAEPGDELCAIPDTASATRIGSIEAFFIGISPSLWSRSRPTHALCLTTHPVTENWQKRQFTTKHLGEKTLAVTAGKRRLPQYHSPTLEAPKRDDTPVAGGRYGQKFGYVRWLLLVVSIKRESI